MRIRASSDSSPSRATGSRNVSLLYRTGGLVLIAVLAVAGLVWWQGNAHAAASLSYSCSASHITITSCDSGIIWTGATNGVKASLSTNHIRGGNGGVIDLVSLQDSTRHYWIQAGVISTTLHNKGAEVLFWADQRPGDTQENMHYGPALGSSDYGKVMNVTITKTASDQFSVSITGLPGIHLSGLSTRNAISPEYIGIGMELAGSSGASAPTNRFTKNMYQDPGSGRWIYQFQGGSSASTKPLKGFWAAQPKGTSNNGGDFRTCIVGAGC